MFRSTRSSVSVLVFGLVLTVSVVAEATPDKFNWEQAGLACSTTYREDSILHNLVGAGAEASVAKSLQKVLEAEAPERDYIFSSIPLLGSVARANIGDPIVASFYSYEKEILSFKK